MPSNEYISFKEASQLLQLSPTTVRSLWDGGVLGGFRTPKGHRRILRKDVLKFLEERDPGITFPQE